MFGCNLKIYTGQVDDKMQQCHRYVADFQTMQSGHFLTTAFLRTLEQLLTNVQAYKSLRLGGI